MPSAVVQTSPDPTLLQPRDPHRYINELDEGAIQRLVDRLESRAKDPVFMRPFERYAAQLPLSRATRVLEVGCGTGAITRALATQPDFAGVVTGVDQSPAMVAHATQLAAAAGLQAVTSFQVGDAHGLNFDDASFDVVIAHTVISHVTDPMTVVRELARVAAPGGTVAVFDGDYASLTFAYEDEALGRKMDHAIAAATFNNRLVMREMPALLRRSGLSIEMNLAEIVAEIGQASFFRSFAETYAPNVKTAKLLSDQDVDRWIDVQRAAMKDGSFFASCNYYTYLARKAL